MTVSESEVRIDDIAQRTSSRLTLSYLDASHSDSSKYESAPEAAGGTSASNRAFKGLTRLQSSLMVRVVPSLTKVAGMVLVRPSSVRTVIS